MLAREVDRGAVDWASLPISGAKWQDLDPLEFERVRKLASTASAGGDRVLGSLADREIVSFAAECAQLVASYASRISLVFCRT